MPVIITLPDELAKKLQAEADVRQQSINQLALDFLEKALEDESFDTQSDFKMLGTQIRATPTPTPATVLKSKEASETQVHNDDFSDFDKIGDKIKQSPSHESESKAVGNGRELSSRSSFSSTDEENEQNRNSFTKQSRRLKGKPAVIASTAWLLDPAVSSINDHKYRVDLEEWSGLWGKVKAEMKYEQLPLNLDSAIQNAREPSVRAQN